MMGLRTLGVALNSLPFFVSAGQRSACGRVKVFSRGEAFSNLTEFGNAIMGPNGSGEGSPTLIWTDPQTRAQEKRCAIPPESRVSHW